MKDTLIQINNYGMGNGSPTLALTLVTKYFELLAEEPTPPSFIVFYNEGVRLTCDESPTLLALSSLEAKGTKLISCSTCLNFFDLKEKIRVGLSGSMSDIISLQNKAQKVITL